MSRGKECAEKRYGGSLTVAHLVFDLARLHVSMVVVGVGLECGQCLQTAEREARRRGEHLKRERQRVTSEQADEPGDARGGHPGIEIVFVWVMPGELVVVVEA